MLRFRQTCASKHPCSSSSRFSATKLSSTWQITNRGLYRCLAFSIHSSRCRLLGALRHGAANFSVQCHGLWRGRNFPHSDSRWYDAWRVHYAHSTATWRQPTSAWSRSSCCLRNRARFLVDTVLVQATYLQIRWRYPAQSAFILCQITWPLCLCWTSRSRGTVVVVYHKFLALALAWVNFPRPHLQVQVMPSSLLLHRFRSAFID